MKIIAYMRVSKAIGQTVEVQKPVIEDWLKQLSGEHEILWLQDEISSRKIRPDRDRAYKLLMSGEYQMLICSRLDRWGRDLREIINSVNDLVDKDCRVVFVKSGFDFEKESMNAATKLQLAMFAAFSEFEREVIRERVLEGLDYAKSQGKHCGRKAGSKDKSPRRKSGYYMRWLNAKKAEEEAKNVQKLNNP